LASIDDAHIACFGRLAAGRFAQPLANATVLLECLTTILILLPAAAWSANEGITLENVVSPGPNLADEPFAGKFSMQQAVRFLDSAALT